MEFDQLKGFYYVAKTGSFTEAAERLYLTQPAISLQVKALEKELGERLFDRVGRGIRLTYAGSLLFKQVEDLIAKLDDIHRTVGEIKSLERGTLHLGASDTTSMYFLPGLLQKFLKAYPKIELGITSLISPQVVQMVKDREIDLGIVTLSQFPPSLEAIPLFQQRLIAIVGHEHPFAARKLIDLSELGREPLILLEKSSTTRQRIDAFFEEIHGRPRAIMELSNFEIIKRYVAAGLGVSLVPVEAAHTNADGICPVPLRQALALQVGIVLRQDRKLTRPSRAFLEMAQEHFGGGALRPGLGHGTAAN